MPSLRGKRAGRQDPSKIKPRFFRRRWVQFCFAGAGAGLIIALVALYLVLKPHKEAAEGFDLAQISHLEIPSRIYDRHGKEIGQIKIENRRPVPLDQVPYHLIQALTAAEDSRFFQHGGVDFIGIARAMLSNLRAGEMNQGASTITQQLANQAFDMKKEKDIKRKLTEAFLAARIEKKLTKSEILEHYLNRIYFGSGYYGIEAAARGYFGKRVSEIDIAEAATICGLIKSPTRLSPKVNPDQSLEQRNYVLKRMHIEGMITDAELAKNLKKKLLLTDASEPGNSYVYEIIRQQVIDQLGFDRAGGGGFKIYTTIDGSVQRSARESLRTNLTKAESHPDFDHPTYSEYVKRRKSGGTKAPDYLQGAVLMVENRTGGIVAMVGGRNFEHSQYNRALQARRPVGTAFTPFVFATAFSGKHFPGSIVSDKPIDNRSVGIGGSTGILGEWGLESPPQPYQGDIPAREALVLSKNAATVRLGKQVGREKVVELAKRAGIESPFEEYDKTLLGSSGATLDEMVSAFSIFPNGGTRPSSLYIISSITDAGGNQVFKGPEIEQVRAIDGIAAYQVHSCLVEALERGTGQYARDRYGLEDDLTAGKTGTAYNFTDLWFVGYNREVTCGVWAGFDTPSTIYRGAFSNTTVLPVWVDAMNAAKPSFQPSTIPFPEGAQTVEICRKSGRRATDACYDELPGSEDGDRRIVRSTYKEVVRANTIFRLFCDVHSASHERVAEAFIPQLTGPVGGDGLPTRPGVATGGGQSSVVLSAPTVVGGADPYDSLQPVLKARPANASQEVRRAVPVSPVSIDSSEIPIRFQPPEPLEIPEVE